MSDEVIKVRIANRLLDEYGKDIQSQKLKAMTRDEFAKLGSWDYISEAYGAYEAVMEAQLLAVKYEMDKTAVAV